MSDRIKKIKIKQSDGTFSDYIPIGANAKDVDMANGYSLENTIGTINVDKEGSIAKQLSKTTKYYDSVADMKADTQLTGGAAAVTLGYYKPNDGGGALYQIIDSTDEDYESLVDDGGSAHDLKNNLKAKLIIENGKINVKYFGAKSEDEEFDNTVFIQNALDYCSKNKLVCFVPIGHFYISNAIKVLDNTTLQGAHHRESVIEKTTNNKCSDGSDYNDYDAVIIVDTTELQGTSSGLFATIENIYIKGNVLNYTESKEKIDRQYGILALHPIPKTFIKNFNIYGVDEGIYIDSLWTGLIEQAEILRAAYRGISIMDQGQGVTIKNINTQYTHEMGIELRGSAYSNLISCLVEWVYGGTAYRFGNAVVNLNGCGYEVGNGVKIGFEFYKTHTTLSSGYLYTSTPDDGDDNNYMFILDQSEVTVKNSIIGSSKGTVESTQFNGAFAKIINSSHLVIKDDCTWHCNFKKPIETSSNTTHDRITIKDHTIFLTTKRVNLFQDWSRSEFLDSQVNPNGGSYLAKHIYLDNVTSPNYTSNTSAGGTQEWQPNYNKGDLLTINNPQSQGHAIYICNKDNRIDFPRTVGTVESYSGAILKMNNISLENYDTQGIRWYTNAVVYGLESGATAYVSTWDYDSNTINLKNITGSFIPGEQIQMGKDSNPYLRNGSWSIVPIINAERSSLRPTSPVAGQMFFDITLNKPIWYNGSNWVDCNGLEI